jgi:aryl-alcohol dehydrogenase-like predicted oxidoreductase
MRGLACAPSPLTLGSVQFGLPYGIANTTGLPDEAAVFALLDLAHAGGVTTIDTARAYGASEDRLGRWLGQRRHGDVHIITKVPPLPQGSIDQRRSALRTSLAQSRQALGVTRLDAVLMHRAEDLLDPVIEATCEEEIAGGGIAAFGASVYEPDTAFSILKTRAALLQVPVSAADRRFERAGVFSAAVAQGVAVFGRSVFLQGALLMDPAALPPHLTGLAGPLRAVRDIAAREGRSLVELLMLAVRDKPGITSIVAGAETQTQLAAQLAAIGAPALDVSTREAIEAAFDSVSAPLLDPSRWPQ